MLLPALTVLGTALRPNLSFAADLPLYLLIVVLTSLVGGFYPALLSAVAGSLLLNYYFTAPRHTFTIDQPSNLVALVIFLLIAVLVSQAVDAAARRSVLAARAGAEAETLSTFAGSLVRGEQALPALLDRVRESFGMQAPRCCDVDADARTWSVARRRRGTRPSDAGPCRRLPSPWTRRWRSRWPGTRCPRATSACWARSPPTSPSPTASSSWPPPRGRPNRWPSPTGSGPRCSTR